jgi:hypothetical protein
MEEPRDDQIFSSLQCHINKEYTAGRAPFIQVDTINFENNSLSRNVGLHFEGSPRLMCSQRGCNERATYFHNFLGRETLYCQPHATAAVQPFERERIDRLAWFCRELVRDKPNADSLYMKVWKVPRNSLSAYGSLSWLWVPENGVFRIYKSRPTGETLYGVTVEKILKKDVIRLLGQIDDEIQRKKPIFVIGFPYDHPFDRPDLSHGHSVGMHFCNECPTNHFDAYCFKYHAGNYTENCITSDADIIVDPSVNVIKLLDSTIQ